MTSEPKEIRLPRSTTYSSRGRDTERLRDEAFAEVTVADLRLDEKHPGAADGAPEGSDQGAATAELADSLRHQLAALQRQQNDLAQLLSKLP